MLSHIKRLLQRLHKEDAGITALETAIILIAFVVVASVFAFTMLSAGTFSTERGKEAVYAGLAEVQSSMVVKGSVLAEAESAGQNATINKVIVTVANAMGGVAIDMSVPPSNTVQIEYRDAKQRATIDDWEVINLVGDDDNLLESGELFEITIPLSSTIGLTSNTEFVAEIKPPSGAVLNIQRTTPAFIEMVNDLK
jgi:archaeal flagellin FlaB